MRDDSTPGGTPAPLDYYTPGSDKPPGRGRSRQWGCVSAVLAVALLALGCLWFYSRMFDFSDEPMWSGNYRQEGGLVVYKFIMRTKGGRIMDCAVSVCIDAPPVDALANRGLYGQGSDSYGGWNAIEASGKPMLKAWSNSKARCSWDTAVPIEMKPITQAEIDMLDGPAWQTTALPALARTLFPSLPATLPTAAPATAASRGGQ